MAKVVITLEDDGDEGIRLSVQGLPPPNEVRLTPAQALALTIQAQHSQEPVFEYAGVDE
jgi:hypothetical protein